MGASFIPYETLYRPSPLWEVVEKGLFKNVQMQGLRNPEE
jgi:hypothetical protein